jgi:hypothetical protein
MKRILKLSIVLFLFSILIVLFQVYPVSASMPSSYSGVSAITPENNGFEMKMQTIIEGVDNGETTTTPFLYFWSSEHLSNNVWVQFGWGCYEGRFLYPIIGVASADNTSPDDIACGGHIIKDTFHSWVGPETFVNGTMHDFKTVFTSETTMSLFVDDVLALVLTPTMVNQILAERNLSDRVSSFSTTGKGDLLMIAETYSGKILTLIDTPIAIATLINGSWIIPNQATLESNYLTDGIGYAGQLQFSNLQQGEIVFGTMVSNYGHTIAWNGHSQPTGQKYPLQPSNPLERLNLPNVPFVSLLALAISGVAIAFTIGFVVTHRKVKRQH